MAEQCDFYCLSYKNPERKEAMENRFEKLGINIFIYPGVEFEDERIVGRKIQEQTKRTWSFTYGHFDNIREFYFNSDKKYGIFCEDDIFIRKDFIEHLPQIIKNIEKMKLDMLLLGYLFKEKIEHNNEGFYLKEPDSTEEHPFSYYNYPNSVWGAQMYMLTREQAGILVEKYSPPYADFSLENKTLTSFNADWTFTKDGNRALIYPMMAIEDGKTIYEDGGQHNFHIDCHKINYVKDLFYE